jgi:hypothetical protein
MHKADLRLRRGLRIEIESPRVATIELRRSANLEVGRAVIKNLY